MTTVWVIRFKAKTRMSDNVTSQPWHIDSVWEDYEDAKRDKERQEAEHTGFDFTLHEADFYRRGTEKQ